MRSPFRSPVPAALLALAAWPSNAPAVTCVQDSVPGATLLVPHFRVSRNGSVGGDIPPGGADTLCSVTNVGDTALLVHVTVWNKYGKAVFSFNVPLAGHDSASFGMRDVLNGRLNVNAEWQRLGGADVCASPPGFGNDRFVRFTNPDSQDRARAASIYGTPAFSGPFRAYVWDSLDESGPIVGITDVREPGLSDADNPACGLASDGRFAGDFSGFLTLDVVNYCTTFLPDEAGYYARDALATTGWRAESAGRHSVNALVGEVVYVDDEPSAPRASSMEMVALEFDARLDWSTSKTFGNRYNGFEAPGAMPPAGVPPAYAFRGDGREPLGTSYAFRFVIDREAPPSLRRSAFIVFRRDRYETPPPAARGPNSLCDWYAAGSPDRYGPYAPDRTISVSVRDDDAKDNIFLGNAGPYGLNGNAYIFLESQRYLMPDYRELNTPNFSAGWISIVLPRYSGRSLYSQAWLGAEHYGSGTAGAGHAASAGVPAESYPGSPRPLGGVFLCKPDLFVSGAPP